MRKLLMRSSKNNTKRSSFLLVVCFAWFIAVMAFAWFVMPDEDDFSDIELSNAIEMTIEQ